ncbi:MAG: hypothetical protein ACK419_06605, partial [Pyrinomonadaceae bacterium]
MFEKIKSLPLEKKVGQLFLIGLPGAEVDSQTQELLEAEKKEIPETIRAFYPEIKIEGASVKLL